MPKVAETGKTIQRLLGQIRVSTRQAEVSDARRRSWRYVWAAPGTVKLADSRDPSKPRFITTHNISAQGMGFGSLHVLEPGCKVLITLPIGEDELQIPATVVHCTESVGGFIVGVSFDLA